MEVAIGVVGISGGATASFDPELFAKGIALPSLFDSDRCPFGRARSTRQKLAGLAPYVRRAMTGSSEIRPQAVLFCTRFRRRSFLLPALQRSRLF